MDTIPDWSPTGSQSNGTVSDLLDTIVEAPDADTMLAAWRSLSQLLPKHFAEEEDTDGLFARVTSQRPQYRSVIQRLKREHGAMLREARLIDRLLARGDHEAFADELASLVDRLRSHERTEQAMQKELPQRSPEPTTRFRIKEAAAATDAGTARRFNEDAVLCKEGLPVFAVADGTGGEGAGDVAAYAALEQLELGLAGLEKRAAAIRDDPSPATRLHLVHGLERLFSNADQEVAEQARLLDRAGMGTTLAAAYVAGDRAYLAHVGNCRAYFVRRGRLRVLTEDHTLGMLDVREGTLSEQDYPSSPRSHQLYRALGSGGEVDVDVAELDLANDDLLLLCSDGLFRALGEHDIERVLRESDLSRAAQALIDEANRQGTRDNLSVVLVRVAADRDAAQADRVAEVLDDVFLFRDLPDTDRHMMAPYMIERRLERGDDLVVEGEPGDAFYVIIEGRVEVRKGDTHLIDLGPGDHLGELVLARPAPRSATATALEDTLAYGLSREHFHQVINRRPRIGARMAMSMLGNVSDRLRDLSTRLERLEKRTGRRETGPTA